MNCLDIKITGLNTPLVIKVNDVAQHLNPYTSDVAQHLNPYTSVVCGVDFSWVILSDASGDNLYDASGDTLLVKIK
jgi:hypothetical protein